MLDAPRKKFPVFNYVEIPCAVLFCTMKHVASALIFHVSWFSLARCTDGVVVDADGAHKAETRGQRFAVLPGQDQRDERAPK